MEANVIPDSSGGSARPNGSVMAARRVVAKSWPVPARSKYSLSIPTSNLKSFGGVVNLESMTQT